jgi:hypothetical protein
MPHARRLLVVSVAILLIPAIHSPAAQPDEVERTYDVRDLLITVPDFTDAPELGVAIPPAQPPAAAPEAENQAATRERLTRDVVAALKLSTAPTARDGQLVVRAAPREHERIDHTLAALRRRHATQVTLDVTLVQLDEPALRQLAGQDAKLADALALADFHGGDRAGTPLTEQQAERLAAHQATRPRMTVFDGQRAYVLVSTLRAFVGALLPDRNARAGVAPQTHQVQSGVVLAAQATAAPDGRTAAVNARVQLCELLAMRETPAPNFPPQKKLLVQVPDYEKRVFAINAVVPHGAPVLFGVTETSRPNAPPDAKPAGDRTFVIVRSAVVRHDPDALR